MALRSGNTPGTLGTKLGPRVASIVTKAAAEHLRRTGSTRARIHAAGLNEFHRQIGNELKGTLSPIFESVASSLPDDHPYKPLMTFMAAQPGEGAAIMGMFGGGFSMGAALSSGITDLLAPTNQGIMSNHPFLPVSPDIAAQAWADGLTSEDRARAEALIQGLDTERQDWLIGLAESIPDLGTLLEMVRRGALDPGELPAWLQRQGYQPIWQGRLAELERRLLSPEQLADMVLRGWLDPDAGAAYAQLSGTTPEDFGLLVDDTGEPPGLEQMLEAYRRGIIDEPRLVHGIKESRVRDEWTDVIEALRFEPMSTADAARAYVEGYLSYDDGAVVAQQNGLLPDHWQYIAESWGRPLAHEQMLSLYHRGQATLDQVNEAFRQSDIKPQYEQQSFDLGRKLPAERLIVLMIQHSAISLQDGLTLLLEQGYTQDDAAAIVQTGANQRTTAHKALVKSDLIAMYAQGLIDAATLEAQLQTLGYSSADASWIRQLEDAKLQGKVKQAAITKVRSAYDGHKIDEPTASNDLRALGVSTTQADALLSVWTIEREANVRGLTEAQILKANKLGAIADPDAETRLMGLGLTQADADLLIVIDGSGGAGLAGSAGQ